MEGLEVVDKGLGAGGRLQHTISATNLVKYNKVKITQFKSGGKRVIVPACPNKIGTVGLI